MNCDEINIYLHDFADGILHESLRPEIETHISKCPACRGRYLALIRLFDLIEVHHESIVPPADLVDNMYNELLSKSRAPESVEKEDSRQKKKLIEKEKLEQDSKIRMMSAAARKSAITRTSFTKIIPQSVPSVEVPIKKILLILLPLVLFSVGYFIMDFMKYNSPWRIVPVKGNYFINGRLDKMNKLSSGKTVLTGENAQAIVNIPLVGKMDAGENTTFTISKAKDGDNRINLRRGFIKVTSLADVPYLAIELKNITVYDRGGIFSVKTDDFNNSTISVEIGNVVVEKTGKSIILSDGYNCTIDKDENIGVPFRTDATENFKTALRELESGSSNSADLVRTLIQEMHQKDVLTLLGVIPVVDKNERTELFNAIRAQFTPPEGVSESGIENADEDMLQSWYDEIEWQL